MQRTRRRKGRCEHEEKEYFRIKYNRHNLLSAYEKSVFNVLNVV